MPLSHSQDASEKLSQHPFPGAWALPGHSWQAEQGQGTTKNSKQATQNPGRRPLASPTSALTWWPWQLPGRPHVPTWSSAVWTSCPSGYRRLSSFTLACRGGLGAKLCSSRAEDCPRITLRGVLRHTRLWQSPRPCLLHIWLPHQLYLPLHSLLSDWTYPTCTQATLLL